MRTTIEYIKEFITLIVQEYEFEEEALLKLWTDKYPEVAMPVAVAESVEYLNLQKMNIEQLKTLCREKGHKVSGKKLELIDRLLGKNPAPTKSVSSKKSKKPIADILQKMAHDANVVNIRRNLFNNYEHVETKFVFDQGTQKVIGKQKQDGAIAPLTDADIITCQEYKFEYDIPAILVPEEKPYDDDIMYEVE